jgi:hypothetical protein
LNAVDTVETPGPRAILQAVGHEVVHQAETRPYATVVAALATGYILGVGTPTWAVRLAMNIGSRVAMARVVSLLAS